jgi:opacity protein-like surface antigen
VRLCGSGMLFILVGISALVAPAASAQSVAEAKTWTATPLLSATFGTSGDLGSSGGIGAALGYDLTSNLGFEGELAHTFDVAGKDADVDWSVTTVSANAVYHFDVKRVTPYATFGLGFERSSIDVKVPERLALYAPSSTEVTYNFGGGAKYPLSDRLLARADLRRFQATDLAPDHWRLYGGLTFWLRR